MHEQLTHSILPRRRDDDGDLRSENHNPLYVNAPAPCVKVPEDDEEESEAELQERWYMHSVADTDDLDLADAHPDNARIVNQDSGTFAHIRQQRGNRHVKI